MKDTVTGLMSMDEFLSAAMQLREEEDRQIVVIYFDLTNFRYFNEMYGFEAGNMLLKTLAVNGCINKSSCRAATRIYADKCMMVYIMEEQDFLKKIQKAAEKIEAYLAENFQDLTMHCHIGMHEIQSGESMQVALDKAEIAWRESKKSYADRIVVYRKGMEDERDKEAKVFSLFRRALAEDRFVIHLQPKIDAYTGILVGAEALVRMQDKDGKLLMPGEFIPILENAGPIVEVDRYVAGKVFCQIRQWMERGIEPVPISINLSGKHFFNGRFMKNMRSDIEDWNVPPEYIELEVTESVFLGEVENIAEAVEDLRSTGVKISMDDFGAGFASMNMICLLPLDIIKLDRHFIQNAAKSYKGREILKKMVELLEHLGFEVVCEGVETNQELKMAIGCGCKVIQGYYYGKPMPIDQFEEQFLLSQMRRNAM